MPLLLVPSAGHISWRADRLFDSGLVAGPRRWNRNGWSGKGCRGDRVQNSRSLANATASAHSHCRSVNRALRCCKPPNTHGSLQMPGGPNLPGFRFGSNVGAEESPWHGVCCNGYPEVVVTSAAPRP